MEPHDKTASVAPHGNVQYHAYTTEIGRNLPQGREEYYVYTPPNYDPKSSTRYPVLYLLHGYDQNALGWQTHGNAAQVLDELVAQGKARPMIVVMPYGYGDYKFFLAGKAVCLSPPRISENVNLFAQMLLNEIIPQVDSDYRALTKREDRAIAGLSMGGREAISIGLRNPREFAWMGGFSAAFPDIERDPLTTITSKPTDIRLLWIAWTSWTAEFQRTSGNARRPNGGWKSSRSKWRFRA